MPGIVGLISKMPRERAEVELSRMVSAQCREAFYSSGRWSNESLGAYVGWTARKNSFSDRMPLCSEQGDVSLVFSGTDYAEPGTALRLRQRGHSLETEGNEYLVHLYEEDPKFPACLNGMFHGLLLDQRRGTCLLFNDRYGMHRVYFYESEKAFYFAAEAKAILAVCPELRTPDPESLGEFVAYSCVLKDRTIFKGIRALPSGSAWIFRNGSVEQRNTYFHPKEWEEQEPLAPDSYYTELREVFSRNLERYFQGSEPVGMTLTGGLDTRTIMAWHKAAPMSLPCYTFGGTLRDCEDVRIAREVAKVCHQSHETISIGEEFLSRFPHYAEQCAYLAEGGVDVYRSSDLFVSEKARKIAPAKIVGTYGSEIIRHDVMLSPHEPARGLYNPDFLFHVDAARTTYDGLQAEHPVTFAAFRQSPWFHHGILFLEETQLSVRSPYLDNDLVRTVYRAPKSKDVQNDVRIRLIQEGNPVLGRIKTDRGASVDSGMVSEAFAAFFFEFTMKAEYAFDYGMPHWLAQINYWLGPLHLQSAFLGRHKSSHFRAWYQGTLSEYVRDVLLDSRTLGRPYLERKGIEAVVHGHLKGNRNYTREIHKMLTLELLHRLFFDSK